MVVLMVLQTSPVVPALMMLRTQKEVSFLNGVCLCGTCTRCFALTLTDKIWPGEFFGARRCLPSRSRTNGAFLALVCVAARWVGVRTDGFYYRSRTVAF